MRLHQPSKSRHQRSYSSRVRLDRLLVAKPLALSIRASGRANSVLPPESVTMAVEADVFLGR
jgi:hypothetical protein